MKQGLSKTELTNADVRKPLFPDDSSKENAVLVDDRAALGDEVDSTSSELRDVRLADEVLSVKTKKGQAPLKPERSGVVKCSPFWTLSFVCGCVKK